MRCWRMRLCIVGIGMLSSLAVAGTASHPLVRDFPGAVVKSSLVRQYEKVEIPVAPLAEGDRVESSFRLVLGDLHQATLSIDGVSTFKIFQNYKDAFAKAGFETIYECELKACGEGKQAAALGRAIAVKDVYNSYHDPYYLVVRKNSGSGAVTVAQFIGGHRNEVAIQQVVVEEVPLELNLVKVDEEYVLGSGSGSTSRQEVGVVQEGDHALLPRYPGAELSHSRRWDSEPIALPLVADGEERRSDEIKLQGDISRHSYHIKNMSSLKVYQNYLSALNAAQFSLVSHCALDACGSKNAAQELGEKLAVRSVYNHYGNPYFILAQKDGMYVGLFIGAYGDSVALQQVIVEEKVLQKDLVSLSVESLKNQMDTAGKVLVYGIYFDTDKANIKPESKPTFEVIARFLSEQKEVDLYVVGHTDDTGKLEHNLSLSQQRAAAVVENLVRVYGIDAGRLLAHGAGPFAPAASNTSDSDRDRNRRVELIKRLDH